MLKILKSVVGAALSRITVNVAKPLVNRLGTMLAAYLIAKGADSDLAAQLVNGIVAAVFVGIDLARDWNGRRLGSDVR